jgi:hypothetical protein
MVRFAQGPIELLAEKFADLANFAVAGLVFGQAVGQETFSPAAALAGIAIWFVLLVFAFAIKRGSR